MDNWRCNTNADRCSERTPLVSDMKGWNKLWMLTFMGCTSCERLSHHWKRSAKVLLRLIKTPDLGLVNFNPHKKLFNTLKISVEVESDTHGLKMLFQWAHWISLAAQIEFLYFCRISLSFTVYLLLIGPSPSRLDQIKMCKYFLPGNSIVDQSGVVRNLIFLHKLP